MFNNTYDSTIKRSALCVSKCIQCGFNSTIVRLKETLDASRHHRNEKFQFYDSTIKSSCSANTRALCIGFNSTIVRLKEKNSSFTSSSEIRFNSTIVRLKAPLTTSIRLKRSSFQFYDSTIKSLSG